MKGRESHDVETYRRKIGMSYSDRSYCTWLSPARCGKESEGSCICANASREVVVKRGRELRKRATRQYPVLRQSREAIPDG